MQDRLRNSGWRIQWIPWWETDKPEIIKQKNPLAFIGVAIFLGAVFWNQFSYFGVTLSESQIIVIVVSGLAISMFGIISSAFQLQAGWKRIDARCIDQEVGEYWKEPGVITSSWGYRLVCLFSFEGKQYTVTPEPSNLASFSSKKQVDSYLNETINQNGSCKLWINPKNPLQTVFNKRRWWL